MKAGEPLSLTVSAIEIGDNVGLTRLLCVSPSQSLPPLNECTSHPPPVTAALIWCGTLSDSLCPPGLGSNLDARAHPVVEPVTHMRTEGRAVHRLGLAIRANMSLLLRSTRPRMPGSLCVWCYQLVHCTGNSSSHSRTCCNKVAPGCLLHLIEVIWISLRCNYAFSPRYRHNLWNSRATSALPATQ